MLRKLSNIWAAMMCVILALACVMPVSAEEQGETKTTSLDVMLVVDDTVSMQRNDPNHIAALALQRFAERIPGEGSRIGMATYDDDILTSTSKLTGTGQPMMRVYKQDDKEKLKEYARTGLTQDGRFTDLPSALYFAVEQIQNLAPLDNTPAIIAVSDGENDYISTAAEALSEQKLDKVIESGIPVYLIVIHAGDSTDVRDYMQGIADDTGGKALFVDSGDEIDTFLVDVVDELYDFDTSANILAKDIGPEPEDWKFSLPEGVFEANIELTHKLELDMELFVPPDGTPSPLEGNGGVSVSSMPDRDGLKTIVRLMEPDDGDYVLRLSSPLGKQPVIGEIILNNEIYVEVDLTPNPAKKGDIAEVTASLMRGGKLYKNLEFTNLEASVSVDGGQPETMERDDAASVFRYNLTVPSKKDELKVTVTVRGQKSFLRSSDPVTLVMERSGGLFDRSHGNIGSGVGSSRSSLPVWVIILAVVFLAAIILAVILMILRRRGGGGGFRQYIRLDGTLTVTYLDDARQHVWENYVRLGTHYTKRNPHECLGKLLREQRTYDEIPMYFDKIQVAGLRLSNGQLCLEVVGEFDTPTGPEKVNQRIEISNGFSADDMGGMGFSDGMSSALVVFPDGMQAELRFSL